MTAPRRGGGGRAAADPAGGGGTGVDGGAADQSGAGAERDDERWMRRALAQARRARGLTWPNPLVGAVVVRKGRMLAEGFHRRAGTPHAEINALSKLGRREAAGSTLYVTLEPCCHIGRTPPCAPAVIAAGVTRVVVGVRDPNPLVNGRGIAHLRRAGVRVDVGCLQDECRAQNRPFFMWMAEGRPLVTMKVAASLDGFIADGRERATAAPVWLTGTAARAAAHRLRGEHDAILVGAGTVLADDPRLTVRVPGASRVAGAPARAKQASRSRKTAARQVPPDLLRVVLDGKLRTPPSATVLAPAAGARTVVVGAVGASAARATALRETGAEVDLLPARQGRIDLRQLLAWMAKRGVQSLLVEGGARVHAAFVAAGLVDRVAFFFAPSLLGGGLPIAATARATGGRAISNALPLGPLSVKSIGADLLVQGDVRRPLRTRS